MPYPRETAVLKRYHYDELKRANDELAQSCSSNWERTANRRGIAETAPEVIQQDDDPPAM